MLCSRGVVHVAALLALAGCNGSGNGGIDSSFGDTGGPDAYVDVWEGDLGNPMQTFPVPTCASANQAPLPDGMTLGGYTCETVGAAASTTTGSWPDTSTLTGPFVYVNAAAAAGGNGQTQATAYQTIEAAVNGRTTAATVIVARGDYTPATTLANTVAVTLVGAGVGATVIHLGTATPVFNAGASLDLREVQIGDATQQTGNAIAIGAQTLSLHDVAIQHVAMGITVTGGTLNATGVSLQHLTGVGILLATHAHATVTQLFADDTFIGVQATASSLTLTDALVSHAKHTGVALLPGSDGTHDHIERVAFLTNTNVGLRIDGADRVVDVLTIMAAGTVAPTGTPGGDGVFVTNGSTANFDVALATEAQMGMGSQYRSNDRIGLLSSTGNLNLHGGLFGSNHGAGVLLQDTSVVSTIGYSVFQQNAGAGTMVASGSTVGIVVCNGFIANQQGTLNFANGAVAMQDGLVMDPGAAGGMVSVLDNTFYENGRYGALIVGLTCTLQGNRFVGNMYNYGAFDTTVTASDNSIAAGAAPPSSAPLATAPDGITEPAF